MSFEVKLFNCHPLYTLLVVDEEPKNWGVYTASPTKETIPMSVSKSNPPLFEHLDSHFETIWLRTDSKSLLIADFHTKSVKLNKEWLTSMYGSDWKNTLNTNSES